MHEVNIRNIDLNLLVALQALLEERHVSRAAERVSLSQPAMSRALGRLRDMFGDPLLVKSRQGMVLTDRAAQLLGPVQMILTDVKELVTPPETDPANMQGEVVIATRDNEIATIVPAIISRVSEEAPNLKINVVALKGHDFSPLEEHKVDFIMSGTQSTIETLHRVKIYDEGFACLTDKHNLKHQEKLTLEDYLAMNHCLVSLANVGMGVVDNILAKKQLSRNVSVRVPYFLSIPYVLKGSDLVVTLPAKLAELFAECHDLAYFEPPLDIPKFSIFLYWHPRHHFNPVHQWIREIVRETDF